MALTLGPLGTVPPPPPGPGRSLDGGRVGWWTSRTSTPLFLHVWWTGRMKMVGTLVLQPAVAPAV